MSTGRQRRLGSLGVDFPDRRLGLKIQLGPAGSGEFRPPDSGQENQPDCDARALRSLRESADKGSGHGGEIDGFSMLPRMLLAADK